MAEQKTMILVDEIAQARKGRVPIIAAMVFAIIAGDLLIVARATG